MAKRFTDTEKWRDEWFCSLSNRDKLIWIYLLDNCDHAGIWKANWQLVKFYFPDFTIDQMSIFGDRVIHLDGDKWFIPKFLKFQYPSGISKNVPTTKGVIKRLFDLGINKHVTKAFGKGFVTLKDKDKDKDKDKESLKEEKRGVGEGEENKAAVPKVVTPAQAFVAQFKDAYQSVTNQPFKIGAKHFIMATELIKSHGLEAVENKTQILAILCKNKSAWFTKDGWASFTIEKLVSRWNEILPESHQESEEEKRERKRKEAHEANERIKAAMAPKR